MFGVLRITLPSKDDVLLVSTRLYPSSVIRAIEDLSDLLQAVSLGLREQEPRGREDDDQKDAEHDVVVPSNIIQRNRVDKGENDERAINGDHLDRKALCSQAVREDLGGVSRDN